MELLYVNFVLPNHKSYVCEMKLMMMMMMNLSVMVMLVKIIVFEIPIFISSFVHLLSCLQYFILNSIIVGLGQGGVLQHA